MKITELTAMQLQSEYLPAVRSALAIGTDEKQSFSVLLCARDQEQAKQYADALADDLRQAYLPQVLEQSNDAGMEQGLLVDTVLFGELTDELSVETQLKLLRADFMLWYDDGGYELEDVIPVASAAGDLFWLVTKHPEEDKELYEVANGFCHPLLKKKGCCKKDSLARSLHGLICVNGGEIRKAFRRQAVKLCCEQSKKEIRTEIEQWQEKRNTRSLQQLAYYYKFLRHWNALDNDLSESGTYYRDLKRQIEQTDSPEEFGKKMTGVALEYSKAYFDKWQQTFLHSIGWSKVCQNLKDSFYRIALNHSIPDTVRMGYRKQNFWERLIKKEKQPLYNHYKEQALLVLRRDWLPALKGQAKRCLAEYEAEYRTLIKTYDAEWEILSECYLELVNVQKQLPQEQL